MNTIHDLGGMDGFTIPERDQGPVLKEEWERQIWGLVWSLRIPGYPGWGRVDIEMIPPKLYLNMPYYARWLHAEEQSLLRYGVVTEQELNDPDGTVKVPEIPNFRPQQPAEAVAYLVGDDSYELEATSPPTFSVGDSVIVKNEHPAGHTRAPRYVRGRSGVVHRHHGVHELQDDVPDGTVIDEQHLYTVKFTGIELWGSRAHPNDRIYAELWDHHLRPAL